MQIPVSIATITHVGIACNHATILMVNLAAINHYSFSERFIHVFNGYGCRTGNLDRLQKVFNRKRLGTLSGSGLGVERWCTIEVEVATHHIIIEQQNAILAVIHDVTERNMAKEQLRESEQIFRTKYPKFPQWRRG